MEDDPIILEYMAESLREAGYEVVEAADGPQAVAALSVTADRFALLITDFHMPGGMDGGQVALQFRMAFPGMPVVIATGRPDIIKPSWRVELGVSLLKKPFGPSELVDTVRQLMGPPRTPGF